MRTTDTAARLGGDEFAVLLEYIQSDKDAIRVAERVLEALAVPFTVVDRQTTVSASIGVALNASFDTVPLIEMSLFRSKLAMPWCADAFAATTAAAIESTT